MEACRRTSRSTNGGGGAANLSSFWEGKARKKTPGDMFDQPSSGMN